MTHEDNNEVDRVRGRSGGAQSPGAAAAAILAERLETGAVLGALAQEQQLGQWAKKSGLVVAEDAYRELELVSKATAENEVFYRAADHRAVKKTWPGTFGFVPKKSNAGWVPSPATPLEYLRRLELQNTLFGDNILVEAVCISSQPSMIIGQKSGGLSLIVSQPWLEAADDSSPHPTLEQIADYLGTRGFSPLFTAIFGWISAELQIVILDAKPDNFIHTHSGILPIDLLICPIPTE